MNDPEIVTHPEMQLFARWRASAHPDLLGVHDLSEMLASGRWFARKFQHGDPVLDRLDTVVDGVSADDAAVGGTSEEPVRGASRQ